MSRYEIILIPSGPFLFHESLVRFQNSPDELVNRYDGNVFRRVICRESGGLSLLEARAIRDTKKANVVLTIRSPNPLSNEAAQEGEAAMRHLLAFDLNLNPFYRMARSDSYLAPLVKKFHGLRPVRYLDLFEALVTAITTQQVNLTFGGLIRSRLVKRWGEKLRTDSGIHYAFPRPERLERAHVDTLLKMQFSRRKAEYLIEVSHAASEGRLDSATFRAMSLDEAIERLCRLRGVGRWSAEQALFRGLGRVEAFPGGDLGIQKVVAWYCYGEKRVDEERVREIARRWAPWEALASTYLFAAWKTGMLPHIQEKRI